MNGSYAPNEPTITGSIVWWAAPWLRRCRAPHSLAFRLPLVPSQAESASPSCSGEGGNESRPRAKAEGRTWITLPALRLLALVRDLHTACHRWQTRPTTRVSPLWQTFHHLGAKNWRRTSHIRAEMITRLLSPTAVRYPFFTPALTLLLFVSR